MKAGQILIMHHELILIGIALVVLIAEIFSRPEQKKNIIILSLVLFALVTAVGFIPAKTGELFGGSYYSDTLTSIMKNILNLGVFIIFLQSVPWLQKQENQDRISEYFLIILSTLIGMDFMISAHDFLLMYIGLELATIPLAALAAYNRLSSKSAEAGIKLIFSSALSTGIMLFGISIIYGTTGSIFYSDITGLYAANGLQTLGFVFFASGMAFKISLVPFHLWTADVYEGSPVNVTSYLSVISKGAAVFTFTIILYRVFNQVEKLWEPLLYTLAITTMTIGNLFAIRQDNMKRFLAFSSIAQAGFILLGIMGANQAGITSVVYFILIYIFTNLAAFGVVSAIYNASGKENISDYKSLYRTNPKLSLVLLLAMFSLAGIPPLAGFFGKFFLFTSVAGKGYYILVLIAVLNATISLYYYLRVVKSMLIDQTDEPIATFKTDVFTSISLFLCVAGIFIIGFASMIYEYIRSFSFGL